MVAAPVALTQVKEVSGAEKGLLALPLVRLIPCLRTFPVRFREETWLKFGMEIRASSAMRHSTIMISTRVKPELDFVVSRTALASAGCIVILMRRQLRLIVKRV
jgi:hypothetical protein